MRSPRQAKILIVEDDVPIAMKMKMDLEAAGFEVPDFATHGSTALRLAEQHKPDLVLVDIRLPDMDGVDLANALQDRFRIRSVFVTAIKTQATRERALGASPLDYLTKPISSEKLLEAVEWALLDLSELEDEIKRTVPNAEEWLDRPHEQLGGRSPRETMGTPREIDLRRMIRRVVQGMPT